jgi:bifunctional DNA-binding transcriptional regulator/antitoxin component of YhaV-PrlF toxin-antitoxin module
MPTTNNNQTSRRLTPFVRLGSKHQVTIPKSIVATLQLEVGDTFEPRTRNGSVILIPKRLADKEMASSRSHKQRTRVKKRDIDNEREDWRLLALNALERAYGDNEPEYTSDLIKEPNPEYERR